MTITMNNYNFEISTHLKSMSSLKSKWYIWLLSVCLSLLVIVIVMQRWSSSLPAALESMSLPSNTSHRHVKTVPIDSSVVFLHNKNLFISLSHLKKTRWMNQLLEYLYHHDSNIILLVTANQMFEGILFNWLAAAQLRAHICPTNVLILSLDDVIYQTLLENGIVSIRIATDEVIRSSALLHTTLSHLWIIRCMITRLLNYWGYDVIMFDLDAVILKDPLPLFKKFPKSDIIGSQGKYPFKLGQKWGVTLCMGVVLFRSTSSTGK